MTCFYVFDVPAEQPLVVGVAEPASEREGKQQGGSEGRNGEDSQNRIQITPDNLMHVSAAVEIA
jgi:hypothetical protein